MEAYVSSDVKPHEHASPPLDPNCLAGLIGMAQ